MSEFCASDGMVRGPASLEYGGVELIPEIMDVMRNSFPEIYGESWNEFQCRSMLLLPGTRLLVARLSGVICGFAFSRMVLDEEELLMIAVDPQHQKKNIGRQLLDQIIKRTREDQGFAIFLEVRSDNSAQKLYHEAGFKKIGIRKEYYTGLDKSKYDATTFKKTLLDRN